MHTHVHTHAHVCTRAQYTHVCTHYLDAAALWEQALAALVQQEQSSNISNHQQQQPREDLQRLQDLLVHTLAGSSRGPVCFLCTPVCVCVHGMHVCAYASVYVHLSVSLCSCICIIVWHMRVCVHVRVCLYVRVCTCHLACATCCACIHMFAFMFPCVL